MIREERGVEGGYLWVERQFKSFASKWYPYIITINDDTNSLALLFLLLANRCLHDEFLENQKIHKEHNKINEMKLHKQCTIKNSVFQEDLLKRDSSSERISASLLFTKIRARSEAQNRSQRTFSERVRGAILDSISRSLFWVSTGRAAPKIDWKVISIIGWGISIMEIEIIELGG